jgi:hypothetical protein
MKHRLLLAAFAVLALVTPPTSARAVGIAADLLPAVQIIADGSVIPVDLKIERLSETEFQGVFNASTSAFVAAGIIAVNTDPFIDYGISVKNMTGGDLNITFLISAPFLDGPWDRLQSSHSSSVTDGRSSKAALDGAITVKATDASGLIHVPQVDGASLVVGAISEGCSPTGAVGFSDGCAGFSNIVADIPATAATGVLGVKVAFSLTAGDIYTGNGRVDLQVVPEPGTALLVGVGLLLAGASARRR